MASAVSLRDCCGGQRYRRKEPDAGPATNPAAIPIQAQDRRGNLPARCRLTKSRRSHLRYRTERAMGEFQGCIPMSQLDHLLNEWELARACEKAAAMDVCDRADDHRLTKHRLAQAEQRYQAAKADAENKRRRIDFIIDARGEIDLDATDDYTPSVPVENFGQFEHYGMLIGPGE